MRASACSQASSLSSRSGRLQRRKGFDQVVRAMPLLLRQGLDVHYAIAGIGDDHDHLQGLARDAGVADRVHLLGPVPHEDLAALVQRLRPVRDAQP